MKHDTSITLLICILSLSVTMALAQASSSNQTGTGLTVNEKQIEKIMSAAYTNLKKIEPWQVLWETEFDKVRQVPTVKALLEKEPDVRWARILLDERVFGAKKEKDYNWVVGIIWRLSGGSEPPFKAHPLEEPFDLVPSDDKGRTELLGTTATMKTIESIYGKPVRVEKGKGEAKKMEIKYYGLIGFYTDQGGDQVKGLQMPFVLFKLGYRDLARLTLKSEGVSKKDSKTGQPSVRGDGKPAPQP